MKKMHLLLLTLLLLAAVSCKKEKKINDPVVPPKKISKWIIGNDTISTDKVIKLNNGPSWFALGFDGGNDSAFNINVDIRGRDINNDSFAIYGPSAVSKIDLLFNYNNYSYRVYDNSNTYLYTTNIDGKIKFTLPPTYFRNLIPAPNGGLMPSNDSTIIQGVFYEP